MLFHPEKKAGKWIDTAEFVHLCYYEYDDDDHGPSLMKSVRLLRREGLRKFWFSADLGGDIEELRHVPVVDAYFQHGSTSMVHLTGILDQLERSENTKSCNARFVSKECWLTTNLSRKKVPIL